MSRLNPFRNADPHFLRSSKIRICAYLNLAEDMMPDLAGNSAFPYPPRLDGGCFEAEAAAGQNVDATKHKVKRH